ncbi:uncharacterized protein EI90DRAFT_3122236 [Cantharellus anzutake]|uniref:uncharacterized protein n=1 Tax=Cantharellus anzutake TaxID=1750568 RepID=UPI0019046EC0|nr:uncharacterized protein EI90DRAFT_3122236 [Cantharellus anzutake]KAF8333177.1 hypothetical protein EI90DRAFT_3122236 [Cantharellus anzutake]
MADNEVPQISTLGPEDEDFVQRSSQSPTISTAVPAGMGKFRLSKIKLRVPEPPPPSLEQQSQTGPSRGEEEEEDQLMDDDLGISSHSFPLSVPTPKPKRLRKSRAKSGNPTLVAPTPAVENASAHDEEIAQLLVPVEPEDPLSQGGEPAAMMSAWQVQVPTVMSAPGSTSDVWDTQEPGKTPKKKPSKVSSTPSSQSKQKRVAPKKIEDLPSAEGTPQPAASSTPAPEAPQEVTLDDVQHFADSGLLSLAPSRPLPIRPFPVQPAPKGASSYASVGPLDRSKNKPRKWQITQREIRTISGGRWIARTWIGDKESGLPLPADAGLAPGDGTPGTPGSATNVKPAKHPKIRLIQRALASRGSPLAKDTDSRRSSEMPRTREPSLDTEMLSLAGDGEPEPAKQAQGGDSEVDVFLGE